MAALQMDEQQFLQLLRDPKINLEDGKRYIQEHFADPGDVSVITRLFENEALDQLYTNPSVSLKIAELLMFFGESIGDNFSHALGLKAKGDVLMSIGLHQAAMTYLDAAAEEFLILEKDGDWGRSRISWIVSCAWLGHVEQALQEAERARNTFMRLGELYWACVIDHNVAIILKQQGRYQESLELYKRALDLYPNLKDQGEVLIARAIAMAKVSYSITLAWVGEFEQAYQLEQEAQATFRLLEETRMVINSEINLANLDYTLGYYGSALRRYYQARDSIVENNIAAGLWLPNIHLWMAKCLVKLNRIEEASELANRAVEMYKQTDRSLSTGDALQEYTTTLIAAGRLKEAMSTLEEVRILFDSGGFEHHAAAVRLQQANLLLELHAFDKAYDEASAVKDYFDAHGLRARSVHASLSMVSALVGLVQRLDAKQEQGQQTALLHKALEMCKHNALHARRSHLQEEVYKSQHLLGTIFKLQGNLIKANRHYEAAIVQVERMLDNLTYDLSPSFLRTSWSVYEDMIALCLEQSQFERAFAYLERARSTALRQYLDTSQALQQETDAPALASRALRARTQQELESWQGKYHGYSALLGNSEVLASPDVDRAVIQQELKRCEEKISELFERLHLHQVEAPAGISTKKRARRSTQFADIARLRLQLTQGQLLVAYCLCKSKLVIFTVTTEGLTTHEISGGVAQLDYLLPVLHARMLPSAQRNQSEVVLKLLQKLYNLLIAPISAQLPPPDGSLIVVPYGPLHNLPFHALYDGSQFLVEKFQINYLPASSVLTWLQQSNGKALQQSAKEKDGVRKPLILGHSGNGEIRRALEEAASLARMLDGQCYLERDATIARLAEQAAGSPIIHVATHGTIRWDAPNFSSVLLADGRLNTIDVFNLSLYTCELVALSGCETGLAQISGGDEQIGLGRAFLAAGARSLLMSLWPVEDDATNRLMQLFYQYLLQGEGKAQALRLAQCALMQQTASAYDHPYFWASFRLVGDPGPLRYQPAVPPSHTRISVSVSDTK
jgi:CHAT domain-containing protein